MLTRLLTLPKNRSFFIFGARGTGKSTLLEQLFTTTQALWIDLLDPAEEDRFARNPNLLKELVDAMPVKQTHIIIDEVQKIPKLLDVIHHLIRVTNKKFILTGSSARKLKHGGANLLAGRAFVYHLFPFSFLELKDKFNLDAVLNWGTLPEIISFTTSEEKIQFLRAYAHTYLKEEIWNEQFIRKLDPFRKFLEVSAQSNGKIINFNNISQDVGVDHKTVKSYFSILEDTLLGFFLEPFKNSFRKRLSLKPKFYYFDIGVTRALTRTLTSELKPRTSAYGEAFEHFIILECIKLASYYYPEFKFSYLKTKDDVEIDLIVERPGLPTLFIEIKSSINVSDTKLSNFIKLTKDFGKCEAIRLTKEKYRRKIENILVLPWQEGIKKYFSKKY
ncbi:MAG: AAA family ATPase [Gammaproteobacteria bacterium]|jgi:predicted AAA+ superfamily ATPase